MGRVTRSLWWQAAFVGAVFASACIAERYADMPLPPKTPRPEVADLIPARYDASLGSWVPTVPDLADSYIAEKGSMERLGAYIREVEAERDSLRAHPVFAQKETP